MATTDLPAFSIKPDVRYLVQNRTPKPIIVESNTSKLVLSPLGQNVVSGSHISDLEEELREMRETHRVRVRPYRETTKLAWSGILVTLGIALLMITGLYALFILGTLYDRDVGIASLLGVALIGSGMIKATSDEQNRRRRERELDIEEGDIDFGSGAGFYKGNETIRKVRQYSVLAWVLVIGALVPAIALIVATDAKSFLSFDGGFAIKAGDESRAVARGMQLIYVAVLSLFPSLMYFQFDRQRVGTVRSRWVRSIFRIDDSMETLSDVNARYGDLLSEASSFSTDTSKTLSGRLSPIVVATILFALGWTILIANTESFDFGLSTEASAVASVAENAAIRAEDAAAIAVSTDDEEVAAAAAGEATQAAETAIEASESITAPDDDGPPPTTTTAVDEARPDDIEEARDVAADAAFQANQAAEVASAAEETVVSTGFFQLLLPDPTPSGMAFLGAYFFAVYLVLRAYLRGDLRPKVYNQITARLVTVVVVAYLISVMVQADDNVAVLGMSFIAGVIPSAVLRKLGERAGKNVILGTLFGHAFGQGRPLTHIDGIDIYERERLAAEGITDVQALAKADIVETMVSGRVQMDRLVDWADQAVLMLHVAEGGKSTLEKNVVELRQVGIRTATELSRVSTSTGGTKDEAVRILAPASIESTVALMEAEPIMCQIQGWLEETPFCAE